MVDTPQQEELPTPQLANEGLATAYVVLPIDAFRVEVEAIEQAIASYNQKNPRHRIAPPQIVYAMGQADLLAHLTVSDFRKIRDFGYPLKESVPLQSAGLVFNWIFSVPYESKRARKTASKKPGIHFVHHVRVSRQLYAQRPVQMESQLVGYLRRLLDSAHFEAEIHTGVGWADFVIVGSFQPEDFEKFVQFIVDVHEARIDAPGGPRGVFRRTFTVLGYLWPANGQPAPPQLPEGATPVMFVRSDPGHLQEIIDSMTLRFEGQAHVKLIDGKSDCVIVFEKAPADFLQSHLAIADLAAPGAPRPTTSPIQKIETHLVFRDASPSEPEDAARRLIAKWEEKLPPPPCGCKDSINASLDRLPISDLPEELVQAVDNILFLFKSTISEQMNCCDVSRAVESAIEGYRRLVTEQLRPQRRHVRAYERRAPTDANRERLRFHHSKILNQHYLIRLWHLFSERFLRQRTIGSFEELHLQSDRAVVYRGSVQKFLFLADCLMNDFAKRIAGRRPPLLFASMYEAVGRIETLRGSGFVHIPVRHLFTLPHVLPDLWHEVGVNWFHYNMRLQEMNLVNSEEDQQFYVALGDAFGDLVVLDHGFEERVSRFVVSLVCAWMDTAAYHNMPRLVLEEELAEVLARICTSIVLLRFVKDPNGLPAFQEQQQRKALFVLARLTLEEQVAATAAGVFKLKSTKEQFRSLKITGRCLDQAVERAGTRLARFGFVLLAKYREMVAKRPDFVDYYGDIKDYNGVLREFPRGTDMNMLFGDLYWYMEMRKQRRVPKSNVFQKAAGLTRSAILEYHSRQTR